MLSFPECHACFALLCSFGSFRHAQRNEGMCVTNLFAKKRFYFAECV